MTGGASSSQIAAAAVLRTRVPDKAIAKELHFITHSADAKPHKHGHNTYAALSQTPSGSVDLRYDADAQAVIDAAKASLKK